VSVIRAADDFAAIRARMEELRRERRGAQPEPHQGLPIGDEPHPDSRPVSQVRRSKLPASIHRSLIRQRALRNATQI
jgi:hypothetical protein